jgi:hypothetical protein
MSFRFRRSLTIFPGVRINFGLSGVSLSFGNRGASLNINKSGVHSNVGLPGTGISYRKRLLNFQHNEAADCTVKSTDLQDGALELPKSKDETKMRSKRSIDRLLKR